MSSIVISIFLLSIGASFIQRTTGFGFGIFIMTMLPFLMQSYGEATTLSGLLAITTSAAIVWRLRSYVAWQRLWPILLTFIIVSTIAIFALTRIEDHILRRILGGVIIGTMLGAYVFKHIPNRIFRYIVYAYICISGVIILMTN